MTGKTPAEDLRRHVHGRVRREDHLVRRLPEPVGEGSGRRGGDGPLLVPPAKGAPLDLRLLYMAFFLYV